ncbi:MAG: TlpA family protein disulfide reductase, partial [Halobacteriaceae archaeon]
MTADTGNLETMEPTPTFDETAFADTVAAFEAIADDIVVRVWGGDWCKDCRAVLPDFAAALDAAGVSDDRVLTYPTEKRDDGSKAGPLVEEYGIEYIPTIVVERGSPGDAAGEELARFVESEPAPRGGRDGLEPLGRPLDGLPDVRQRRRAGPPADVDRRRAVLPSAVGPHRRRRFEVQRVEPPLQFGVRRRARREQAVGEVRPPEFRPPRLRERVRDHRELEVPAV